MVLRSAQVLEAQSQESEEVDKHKELRKKAFSLLQRAILLEKRGTMQSWLINHLWFGPKESAEELKQQAMQLYKQSHLNLPHPLKDQLRTPSLAPEPADVTESRWTELVEEVAESRARLLMESGTYPNLESLTANSGKLLRYEPEDNERLRRNR